MPYFEVLTQQTAAARSDLFAVPVIEDALAGRITRAQYLAFLAEAYHHVRHTVPLLMACGSRLPESKSWMRTAIVEYIAEEAGHEEWILNDIAAAGGDPRLARDGSPSPATELMVAYVYDTIARRNPLGFFGMVHVLEGTSTAPAPRCSCALWSGPCAPCHGHAQWRAPPPAMRALRQFGVPAAIRTGRTACRWARPRPTCRPSSSRAAPCSTGASVAARSAPAPTSGSSPTTCGPG